MLSVTIKNGRKIAQDEPKGLGSHTTPWSQNAGLDLLQAYSYIGDGQAAKWPVVEQMAQPLNGFANLGSAVPPQQS